MARVLTLDSVPAPAAAAAHAAAPGRAGQASAGRRAPGVEGKAGEVEREWATLTGRVAGLSVLLERLSDAMHRRPKARAALQREG